VTYTRPKAPASFSIRAVLRREHRIVEHQQVSASRLCAEAAKLKLPVITSTPSIIVTLLLDTALPPI
jgi:hypothetical protein